MSEDEQSWSFCDTRSNLKRGRLLICAMTHVRPGRDQRWPMDNRAFAKAVDWLTPQGNVIAKAIHTYPGVAGQHCPDFDEMLSFALSSLLIEYLSPQYREMIISVGPQMAKDIIRGFLPEELEAAKQLAQAFWDFACGEPPDSLMRYVTDPNEGKPAYHIYRGSPGRAGAIPMVTCPTREAADAAYRLLSGECLRDLRMAQR